MDIRTEKQGNYLKISVEGRLDTLTSPSLESTVKENTEDVTELEFDLSGLSYISSAGLRVLLGAQKMMNGKGKMTVSHACADVLEIFDITGFSDILTLVD